jgi:hypothetical protein
MRRRGRIDREGSFEHHGDQDAVPEQQRPIVNVRLSLGKIIEPIGEDAGIFAVSCRAVLHEPHEMFGWLRTIFQARRASKSGATIS